MNHQAVVFFVAVGVFLAMLGSAGGYALVKSRRRASTYGDWEAILARFTKVDRDNVARIALDFMTEAEAGDGDADATEPPGAAHAGALSRAGGEELDLDQIWPMIGGLNGLETLHRNCAAMVDMAFYVQQWYPEALGVAEQLRLHAREIEWHVERLKGAAQTGKLEAAFPDYAQRAVTIYYLMTRQVIDLFQQGDFPGLFDVQKAM